jgi:hypothetical protein
MPEFCACKNPLVNGTIDHLKLTVDPLCARCRKPLRSAPDVSRPDLGLEAGDRPWVWPLQSKAAAAARTKKKHAKASKG